MLGVEGIVFQNLKIFKYALICVTIEDFSIAITRERSQKRKEKERTDVYYLGIPPV